MSDAKSRYRRISELFAVWHELAPSEREDWWRARAREEPRDVLEGVQELLRQDQDTFPELDDLISDLGPALDLPLPDRLGPFRILEKIGEGGMGMVFEAEQIGLGRRVALKVLRSPMGGEALVRRFAAEAKTLALLDHPGIARLYDAGLETGEGRVPWIAMELVRGRTLDQFVRTQNPDRAGRLGLIAAVCDAVEHAHQRGIVHRDLKPSNVLVQEDGAVKILDFGIARLLDPDHAAALTTNPGQVLGTLAYMSPEQAAGESARVGPPSDVYSLGVMLHELLAGRRPIDIEGASLTEALRRIQVVPPARLGLDDPALRGDLEVIAARALEKDPELRFPTASGLAADLRRHLRDEPILSRPPSTWRSIRSFAKRHRALVGASLFAAVALAAATVVSLVFAFRAEDARRDAEVLSGQELAARKSADEARHAAEAARKAAEEAGERAKEEARIARQEADTTEALLDFVRAGLLEVDPLNAAAGEPTLRHAVTEMTKRVPRLEGKPIVRARMQAFLASLASGLADYETAATLIVPALEVLEAEEQSHDVLLDALRASAWIHHRMRKQSRAARDAKAAIVVAERAGPRYADFRANVLILLGEIQMDSGQIAEARNTFEAAVADLRSRHQGDRAEIALSHMVLGLLAMAENDHEEAVRHGELSVAMRERLFTEKHPYVAESLHNLAMMRNRAGDFDGAIRDVRRGIAIRAEVMHPEHPAVLSGHRLLAAFLMADERYEEALEASLAISPNALARLPKGSNSYHGVMFNRAVCFYKLERWEEGWSAFEQLASSMEHEDAEDSELLAVTYLNWGECLFRAKRFDEALLVYSRMVEYCERTNAPQLDRLQALAARGATYDRLGQPEKARVDLLRAIELAGTSGLHSKSLRSVAESHIFLAEIELEAGEIDQGLQRSDRIIAELQRLEQPALEHFAIERRLSYTQLADRDKDRVRLAARLEELKRRAAQREN